MKKALRELVTAALVRVARPVYGGIGCIICLHRVLPEEERSPLPGNRALEITPDDLREVIEWSRSRGLEAVAMDEVPARLRKPKGDKFVAFTFDDGYRDNLLHALPIFRDAGVHFTVNVTTGFVTATEPVWWYAVEQAFAGLELLTLHWRGNERSFSLKTLSERDHALEQISGWVRKMGVAERNEWLGEFYSRIGIDLPVHTRSLILDWDELRELASDPLVSIGAHTIGHHDFSQLSESEARVELSDSKRELEAQLKRPVRHLAFPFGGRKAVGERDFQLARECGFETAVTTRSANLFRAHAQHLTALPRLGISGNYEAVPRFKKLESGLLTAIEQQGVRLVTE
ncbi:MAG: hypothetical protein EOP84_23190 [Verrucomicrobiaceae bacterium]|nr:MAG: hypothetical protein EOP84_23190 [Verrucomicrobiaceae bacterium]